MLNIVILKTNTFQPPLHIQEPIFVNPCSYSAVVLRKIQGGLKVHCSYL